MNEPAPPLPNYPCPQISEPLETDGDLSKPAWERAPVHWLLPATGRGQGAECDSALFLPGSVAPAQNLPYQPTAFRACWTSEHLYVGFQCLDRDIWSTCMHRDEALYEEEVVEAFLCPTGDLTRYYELEISPRNVVFDASVHSPDLNRTSMSVETSWECSGLRSAVRVEGTLDNRDDIDRWWTVEIAIPFAAFSEAQVPRAGSEWRCNFYRIDRANPPEFTAWSPTLEDPPNFHVPLRFGRLLFQSV